MKKKKYDIIIYVSLIMALICIGIGAIDYFKSSPEEPAPKVEKTETTNTSNENKNETYNELEPEKLIELDKKTMIKRYFDSISDQTKTNDIITADMVNGWSKYEVLNVKFNRTIVDEYYSYTADIIIYGENITLPIEKNTELSTEEYSVITLNFNILRSGKEDRYIIKSIEIPEN